MYRLMIPEMRVLEAGYNISQREAEDQQKGISSGQRSAFSEFSSEIEQGNWHKKHGVI